MDNQPCPCCGHDQVTVRMVIKDEFEENQALKAKVAGHAAEVERLTAERDALKEELEHERVRLAACGVAAMGYEDKNPLEPGDYGYSASYGDVLRFRGQILAERDAAVARAQGLDHVVDYIRERLGLPEDIFEDDAPRAVDALCKERDAAVARLEAEKLKFKHANQDAYRLTDLYNAAVARAERSEEALRPFACLDMSPYENARDDRIFYNLNETQITVGDVRHAIAILAGHAPATPMLDQLAAPPQPITVQAAPSDRERRLELACKEVLATPSFGALRSADAVDTIKIVRAALAAAPDKPQYAALSPEPWGGPEGEE